jgi:hypothetical protein
MVTEQFMEYDDVGIANSSIEIWSTIFEEDIAKRDLTI